MYSTNIIDVNGKLILGPSKDTPKIPLLLDNTKTTVTEVVSPKDKLDNEPLLIQTPIFILFAEFLGYVSHFVNIAEDWCNPKRPFPSEKMQVFLEREARTIYDEMLCDFSETEIHTLYKTFYTCGLDEIEDDLIQKRKDGGEDLPF